MVFLKYSHSSLNIHSLEELVAELRHQCALVFGFLNAVDGGLTVTKRVRRGRVNGALLCLPLRKPKKFEKLPPLVAAKELARCMHEVSFTVPRSLNEVITLPSYWPQE